MCKCARVVLSRLNLYELPGLQFQVLYSTVFGTVPGVPGVRLTVIDKK